MIALTVTFAAELTIESDSDASIDAVQLLAKLLFRNITAFGPGKAMLEMSSVIDDFAEESRLRSVPVENLACFWDCLLQSRCRKELVSQQV